MILLCKGVVFLTRFLAMQFLREKLYKVMLCDLCYMQNDFLLILLVIFLLFLTHVVVEKVLFLSQIFEMKLLTDSHVMRSPESKNRIFSIWSVCLCVCLSLCVPACLLSA